MMINIQELLKELNSEQQKAANMPIESFTKIVAGAGTGKTKTITKRYVKLVNDLIENNVENPIEKLLVITFTEKAAAEMKEKIFKELKNNNIKYYNQENYISTIHGFCSRVLKKFSIEGNLSPNFKVGDENELEDIYNDIIQKIKYGEYNAIQYIKEVTDELNIKDYAKLLQSESLLKLIKINDLNTIFDNILPIVQKIKSMGVTPQNFLAKTITGIDEYNKIIENLKIYPAYTTEEHYDIWGKILQDYCATYFGKEEFNKIASSIITRKGPAKPDKWIYKENLYATLEEISVLEKYLTKIIAIIYALYEKHLEENDLIDFDDMINKTIWVLEQNENIRKYYQKQFKHIIVDEFQDTNEAQMKLLLLLMSDENPNITVVGDRKQSIYAFRYANVENLDLIQEKIEKKYNKKYSSVSLDTNYRSIPEILDVANVVTEKILDYPNECLTANKKTSQKEIPVKISHLSGFDNSNEHKVMEGKYIASEILKYKKRDNLKFKDFAILVKNHKKSEIFEEQLTKFGIPAIKKANKNYFSKPVIKNIVALLNFVSDIKDEKSFVRIMQIKFSDKDLYDLCKTIEKETINNENIKYGNFCEKLYYCIEENLFNKFEINNDLKNDILKLLNLAKYIDENKKSLSIHAIYKKLVTEMPPYFNLYEAEGKIADRNLAIFEKIIIDFQKKEKNITLKNFVNYIKKAKEDKFFELPNIDTEEIDAVQIITIHSSKGLEYPYVFVSSITNKDNPSDKSCIHLEISDEHNFGLVISKYNKKYSPKKVIYSELYKKIKSDEEENRLFYVALTRAKDYLNIITFDSYPNVSQAKYIEKFEKLLPDITKNTDTNNIELQKKSVMLYDFTDKAKEKIKAQNIVVNEDKNYQMSFSKIHTFKECQYKYLLQYVYNYPNDNKQNTGVETGSIFHNLIYNTFINGKFFSSQDIQEFFKDAKDVDTDKILKMYDHFKNSEYSKFKQKDVLPEYSFEFTYQNAIFKGDIDLVWKNENGGIDIIDFKTNKDIKNSLFDYYKQMVLYKKAMESQGFKVNNLFILHFKEDGIDEYKLSEKDIKTAEKEFNQDIENILSFKNESATKNTEANCFTCGYKYICNIDKSFIE